MLLIRPTIATTSRVELAYIPDSSFFGVSTEDKVFGLRIDRDMLVIRPTIATTSRVELAYLPDSSFFGVSIKDKVFGLRIDRGMLLIRPTIATTSRVELAYLPDNSYVHYRRNLLIEMRARAFYIFWRVNMRFEVSGITNVLFAR